jgi:peptidoglycan/xylan/chitin deacetylase (PgdA/CDA1 family)
VPFSLDEAYQNFVRERWVGAASRRKLTSQQLAIYYALKKAIPRRAQIAARRRFISWQGRPSFPHWPYDDSVVVLIRFYAACVLRALGRREASFPWFWPNGYRAAAILTHDVETAEGLRNALRVARLEEDRGLRSSFNLVGSWYPIDWGIVRDLRSRGHEIGSHGLYHDRSLFSTRASFESQLPQLTDSIRHLGAKGFRSPATHRVHEWIAQLPVEYDCTVPHSDPYEPQPGGCCSVWPFFLGRVVELPYTLPQDHLLFTLMGESSAQCWIDQARRLRRSYGLIQCISHPDLDYLGTRRNEEIYCRFLDVMRAEGSVWWALPQDVAQWWRSRAAQHTPGFGKRTMGRVLLGDGVLADIEAPKPHVE